METKSQHIQVSFSCKNGVQVHRLLIDGYMREYCKTQENIIIPISLNTICDEFYYEAPFIGFWDKYIRHPNENDILLYNLDTAQKYEILMASNDSIHSVDEYYKNANRFKDSGMQWEDQCLISNVKLPKGIEQHFGLNDNNDYHISLRNLGGMRSYGGQHFQESFGIYLFKSNQILQNKNKNGTKINATFINLPLSETNLCSKSINYYNGIFYSFGGEIGIGHNAGSTSGDVLKLDLNICGYDNWKWSKIESDCLKYPRENPSVCLIDDKKFGSNPMFAVIGDDRLFRGSGADGIFETFSVKNETCLDMKHKTKYQRKGGSSIYNKYNESVIIGGGSHYGGRGYGGNQEQDKYICGHTIEMYDMNKLSEWILIDAETKYNHDHGQYLWIDCMNPNIIFMGGTRSDRKVSRVFGYIEWIDLREKHKWNVFGDKSVCQLFGYQNQSHGQYFRIL